jgi:hypothetical protein
LKKILLKMLVAAVALCAAPATAMVFSWSFTPDSDNFGSQTPISGFIFNLKEGVNNGSLLTASVTQSPFLIPTGRHDFQGASLLIGDFFVEGGEITYSNARFTFRGSEILFGGAMGIANPGPGFSPRLSFGTTSAFSTSGMFYNLVVPDDDLIGDLLEDPNFFPGVPETANWILLIMGFGFVGSSLRRNRNARAKAIYSR